MKSSEILGVETLAARYRVAIKNAQWRPGGKRQV